MTTSPALHRMMRARSALILTQPFFGTLALRLDLVETEQYKTLATDGRSLYFNPGYVVTLSDDEIVFGIAHEVEHCALKHTLRRGNRDPEMWNVACDHPVNLDLKRAGFKLPPKVLCDEQYAGLGAEAIYRILDQQQRAEEQDNEQSDDESDNKHGSDDQSEDQPEPTSDDAGDGEGDDGSDDTSSDTSEPGEPTGDDGDAGGDAPSDDTSEGSGQPGGGAQPGTDAGEGGQGDGHPADGNDPAPGSNGADGEGEGEPSDGPPGPEDVGEVLDAAPDATGEAGEIEADWDTAVRQAINVAKAHAAGSLPGHLERLVETLKESKTDWRDVLRRFVTPSSRTISTWSRPNRRFVSSGLFLPGSRSDGVNHIAWIVDTSGSMDEVALAACRAELQAALDEGIVDKFTVVYCDAEVAGTADFTRGEIITFEPKGGGGTAFAPAFAWLNENEPDVTAAIYFTDLACDDFGTEPTFPVLWAAYGDPRYLKLTMPRVPFGECLEIAY